MNIALRRVTDQITRLVERFSHGSRYKDLVHHDQQRHDLTMVVPAGKLSTRYPLQELCVTDIRCRNWHRGALAAVHPPNRTAFPLIARGVFLKLSRFADEISGVG